MNLKVTISIDDVNPQTGYRILGEQTEVWLRKLNEEFGAKFTLFIPSNYHGNNPLSENKEWVKELASIEWLELAAHGHFHMTSDPKKFGECEMVELNTLQKCEDRFVQMLGEWHRFGIQPTGWRNPGWVCSNEWNTYMNMLGGEGVEDMEKYKFIYAAVHYEHNRGLEWNCKTFFGHDGIQQEHISIHNSDMIMFQSHIAGNHNHNVWNEDNFNQLHASLEHLVNNYECTFKTLRECV